MQRYESEAALIQAIRDDVDEARRILASPPAQHIRLCMEVKK
jgi:hypothetical protein